jgi:hypothetical protein
LDESIRKSRLVDHRATEHAHRAVQAFQRSTRFVERFQLLIFPDAWDDFLLIEDLLVALILPIAADEDKILLGIGQDEEDFPLALHAGDVTLGQRLDPCYLDRGNGCYGLETGLAQVALLLLKMGGAGRQDHHEQKDGKARE